MAKYLKLAVKAPVYFYRYAISPLIGPRCRHLPTCSQYALDAIDLNGAWIGGWLAVGRILRCHPWGTHGYDPAPDSRMRVFHFGRPGAPCGAGHGVLPLAKAGEGPVKARPSWMARDMNKTRVLQFRPPLPKRFIQEIGQMA